MMQKVRGVISAFLGFTCLFHLVFQHSLAVLSLSLHVLFLSPILKGENDLFVETIRVFGFSYCVLLFLVWLG